VFFCSFFEAKKNTFSLCTVANYDLIQAKFLLLMVKIMIITKATYGNGYN